MAPRTLPEKTRALVLRLYGQGLTNKQITERTGVGAGTLYWVLHQAGVKPDRLKTKAETDHALVTVLLESIRGLERTVGRLEAELDMLRRQNGRKGTT